MFNYPSHLDPSVISQLENYIIEICSTCPNISSLKTASAPIWTWASAVLKKDVSELRREIEAHETDEHFPNPYLEEKGHLLKLPLIILAKMNS